MSEHQDESALLDELAALRQPVEPERDLWPAIDAATEPKKAGWLWPTLVLGGGGLALAGVAAVLLIGIGVAIAPETDLLAGLGITPAPTPVAVRWERPPSDGPIAIGHAHLRDGDLLAADTAFAAAVQAHPDRADAKIAYAYTRMLSGDHDQADALLAEAASTSHPDQLGDIQIRRAIVAFQRQDFDGVQRHAEASGLPAGLVLAAEVYLADAESDAAVPLLRQARRADDPRVTATAETYLAYLDDGETGRSQIAETVAMWALGMREEAVEASEELLVSLPVQDEERDELLLLWAGRAAATGRDDIAEALLDEMSAAPIGQSWRIPATRAIILATRSESDEAAEIFDQLDLGGAPEDGVRDARLTAALVSPDEQASRVLLAGLDGPGAALLTGEASLLDRVDTPLDRYLRGR